MIRTALLCSLLVAAACAQDASRSSSEGGKADSLTCNLMSGDGCGAHQECMINPNSGCIDDFCPGVCVDKPIEIVEICVAGSTETIPAVEDLGFESETCLIWNRDDAEERFDEIRYSNLDSLTVQQLRMTLDYFCFEPCPFDANTATVEELLEDGEDPFFYLIRDKESEELYTVINVAQGDTPLELAFAYGTLEPVAVTQDSDLSFCRADLIGR